ncbi:MAG: DUF1993 domain-containing protein [Sneathiella sp.]|nr:DUF1993 domain-containing protein [Sneathiella sp.]
MKNILKLFTTRLDVLDHILDVAVRHFADDPDAMLQFRLAGDMFPLSMQIAFTCGQPNALILWCEGKPHANLDGEFATIAEAKAMILETKSRIAALDLTEAQLGKVKRLGLGPGRHAELKGADYISEYLIPNFYFHLVTAYDILRHNGVPLGKADFLRYLAPHIRQD